MVGIDKVLIGLHEFLGDDIELFPLFLYHDAHIVHDLIDAQGGLFNFIDDLILLEHDLAFQFVIDLDMVLIGQQ